MAAFNQMGGGFGQPWNGSYGSIYGAPGIGLMNQAKDLAQTRPNPLTQPKAQAQKADLAGIQQAAQNVGQVPQMELTASDALSWLTLPKGPFPYKPGSYPSIKRASAFVSPGLARTKGSLVAPYPIRSNAPMGGDWCQSMVKKAWLGAAGKLGAQVGLGMGADAMRDDNPSSWRNAGADTVQGGFNAMMNATPVGAGINSAIGGYGYLTDDDKTGLSKAQEYADYFNNSQIGTGRKLLKMLDPSVWMYLGGMGGGGGGYGKRTIDRDVSKMSGYGQPGFNPNAKPAAPGTQAQAQVPGQPARTDYSLPGDAKPSGKQYTMSQPYVDSVSGQTVFPNQQKQQTASGATQQPVAQGGQAGTAAAGAAGGVAAGAAGRAATAPKAPGQPAPKAPGTSVQLPGLGTNMGPAPSGPIQGIKGPGAWKSPVTKAQPATPSGIKPPGVSTPTASPSPPPAASMTGQQQLASVTRGTPSMTAQQQLAGVTRQAPVQPASPGMTGQQQLASVTRGGAPKPQAVHDGYKPQNQAEQNMMSRGMVHTPMGWSPGANYRTPSQRKTDVLAGRPQAPQAPQAPAGGSVASGIKSPGASTAKPAMKKAADGLDKEAGLASAAGNMAAKAGLTGLKKAWQIGKGSFAGPMTSLGSHVPAGILQGEREAALKAGNNFLQTFKPQGFQTYAGRVKTPGSIAGHGTTGMTNDMLGMRLRSSTGDYSQKAVDDLIQQLKGAGVNVQSTKLLKRPGYHGWNIKADLNGTPTEFQLAPRRLQGLTAASHSLQYKPQESGVIPWIGNKVYGPAISYGINVTSPFNSVGKRMAYAAAPVAGVGAVGAGAYGVNAAMNRTPGTQPIAQAKPPVAPGAPAAPAPAVAPGVQAAAPPQVPGDKLASDTESLKYGFERSSSMDAITLMAKLAAQDNSKPSRSALGEDHGITVNYKEDDYDKGPAAWKNSGKYLKHGAKDSRLPTGGGFKKLAAEDKGEVESLVTKLFAARQTLHALHLKSKDYAEHVALGELYDSLLGLIDQFVETYQGQYGLVTHAKSLPVDPDADPKTYLDKLCGTIRNVRAGLGEKDTHLQNILDEMLAAAYQTIYKLTYLGKDSKQAADESSEQPGFVRNMVGATLGSSVPAIGQRAYFQGMKNRGLTAPMETSGGHFSVSDGKVNYTPGGGLADTPSNKAMDHMMKVTRRLTKRPDLAWGNMAAPAYMPGYAHATATAGLKKNPTITGSANPAITAHEMGHAMGPMGAKAAQLKKYLWGGRMAGQAVGSVGGLTALFAKDEDTARKGAIAGTLGQLPVVGEEVGASMRGANMLKRMQANPRLMRRLGAGLKGVNPRMAYVGVPTYLLQALGPAAIYGGRKAIGGFKKEGSSYSGEIGSYGSGELTPIDTEDGRPAGEEVKYDLTEGGSSPNANAQVKTAALLAQQVALAMQQKKKQAEKPIQDMKSSIEGMGKMGSFGVHKALKPEVTIQGEHPQQAQATSGAESQKGIGSMPSDGGNTGIGAPGFKAACDLLEKYAQDDPIGCLAFCSAMEKDAGLAQILAKGGGKALGWLGSKLGNMGGKMTAYGSKVAPAAAQGAQAAGQGGGWLANLMGRMGGGQAAKNVNKMPTWNNWLRQMEQGWGPGTASRFDRAAVQQMNAASAARRAAAQAPKPGFSGPMQPGAKIAPPPPARVPAQAAAPAAQAPKPGFGGPMNPGAQIAPPPPPAAIGPNNFRAQDAQRLRPDGTYRMRANQNVAKGQQATHGAGEKVVQPTGAGEYGVQAAAPQAGIQYPPSNWPSGTGKPMAPGAQIAPPPPAHPISVANKPPAQMPGNAGDMVTGASDLSPFARAFFVGCRQHGLTDAQMKVAADKAMVHFPEAAAELRDGLTKMADWRAEALKWGGNLLGKSKGLWQSAGPKLSGIGKPLGHAAMGAYTGYQASDSPWGALVGAGLGAAGGSKGGQKFLKSNRNLARSYYGSAVGGTAGGIGDSLADAAGFDTEGAGGRWGSRMGLLGGVARKFAPRQTKGLFNKAEQFSASAFNPKHWFGVAGQSGAGKGGALTAAQTLGGKAGMLSMVGLPVANAIGERRAQQFAPVMMEQQLRNMTDGKIGTQELGDLLKRYSGTGGGGQVMGQLNQLADHALATMGLDPSSMHPWQKIAILAGGGALAGGAMAGSAPLATMGGMAAAAGAAPGLMQRFHGQMPLEGSGGYQPQSKVIWDGR